MCRVFIIWLAVCSSCHAITIAPSFITVAEYNPFTGQIQVSGTDIEGWDLISTGSNLTGDAAANLPSFRTPFDWFDTDYSIGEWTYNRYDIDHTYGILDLGNVAEINLPLDDLRILWRYRSGSNLIQMNERVSYVNNIPEPTTTMLSLMGIILIIIGYRNLGN